MSNRTLVLNPHNVDHPEDELDHLASSQPIPLDLYSRASSRNKGSRSRRSHHHTRRSLSENAEHLESKMSYSEGNQYKHRTRASHHHHSGSDQGYQSESAGQSHLHTPESIGQAWAEDGAARIQHYPLSYSDGYGSQNYLSFPQRHGNLSGSSFARNYDYRRSADMLPAPFGKSTMQSDLYRRDYTEGGYILGPPILVYDGSFGRSYEKERLEFHHPPTYNNIERLMARYAQSTPIQTDKRHLSASQPVWSPEMKQWERKIEHLPSESKKLRHLRTVLSRIEAGERSLKALDPEAEASPSELSPQDKLKTLMNHVKLIIKNPSLLKTSDPEAEPSLDELPMLLKIMQLNDHSTTCLEVDGEHGRMVFGPYDKPIERKEEYHAFLDDVFQKSKLSDKRTVLHNTKTTPAKETQKEFDEGTKIMQRKISATQTEKISMAAKLEYPQAHTRNPGSATRKALRPPPGLPQPAANALLPEPSSSDKHSIASKARLEEANNWFHQDIKKEKNRLGIPETILDYMKEYEKNSGQDSTSTGNGMILLLSKIIKNFDSNSKYCDYFSNFGDVNPRYCDTSNPERRSFFETDPFITRRGLPPRRARSRQSHEKPEKKVVLLRQRRPEL